MYNITASTITKLDPTVKVSTSNEMTPELQQLFVQNIAYQAYMWVPVFTKAIEEGGVPYNYYPLILPSGCTLELTAVSYDVSLITGIRILDPNSSEILSDNISTWQYLVQDKVTEFISSRSDYILRIGRVIPFTLFARIKS